MYLSRVKLNNKIRNTYKFYNSQQVAHASIEACFGSEDNSRKLWRLDYYQGQAYILVLSENKPNFSAFIDQFGYPNDSAEIKDYQKLLDFIQVGQQYKFRLCASPTRCISHGVGKRGTVTTRLNVEQQEQWLSDKSSKNGFKLLASNLVGRNLKKFRRKTSYITMPMTTFEGVLEVVDLELFKQALTMGIGREKAYGCGLLTLAR